LQGIIDSLDYIRSLGVNAIWLTPIFESENRFAQSKWIDRLDATGYYTTNYFKIDPNFGDLASAKKLVDAAHEKGLYVFFDGVFGHHKGKVAQSPNGLKPTDGRSIGDVGFQSKFPDDLEFYKEVATYWVKELKIDGWRLDQAYQVPLEAWREIRQAVEKTSATVEYKDINGDMVNPLAYMVAEIWKDGSQITQKAYGQEGDSALLSSFAFPLRYALVQTLAVEESGKGYKQASNLNEGFSWQEPYPSHAMPNLMLGNHDLVRFGDLLQRGYIASKEMDSYWARHKAAFSFMTAYSGPITLYYGEEIGDELEGFAQIVNPCSGSTGKCDDHVARTSANIDTVNIQLNEQQRDLKNYVSKLMQIRLDNPALYNGSRTHIYSDPSLYIDKKVSGENEIVYFLNTKNRVLNITISPNALGLSSELLLDLIGGRSFSVENGNYQFSLEPFGVLLLKIQ